jgi:hypothetical protein
MEESKNSISSLHVAFAAVLLVLTLGTIWGVKAVVRSLFPENTDASVRFLLDHNRMIVEVEFVRPDQTLRKASAWVDLGSPHMTMAAPLAHDLGIEVTPNKDGTTWPAPEVRLGGLTLQVDKAQIRLSPGAFVRPGIAAEATLPASIFKQKQVILDYPAQRLIIVHARTTPAKGVAIPCRINGETGLVMINVVINGDTLAMGLDNGSAGTWVSDTLTGRWKTHYPHWRTATGAAGSANFFGFPFEVQGTLMRLQKLVIGGMSMSDVAVLGLDQSLFDWYSLKSAGPVCGFIGANVLKNFRLTIDFPNQMTFWEKSPSTSAVDLDLVGLTLRPEADNSWTIIGVVAHNGKPVVEGIQAGDKLLAVDQLAVAGATMGTVLDALRGTPGTARTLLIERAHQPSTVAARVMRLP